MKPGRCLCVCVLLVLSMAGNGNGGNILVWFTEGSHWINLKPVLEALIDRGHQVTVLVPSSSLFMNASEPSRFHYEPFNSSVPLEVWEEIIEEFIHFSIYEMDYLSYIQIHIKFLEIAKKEVKFTLQHLDSMVRSDTMARLREGKFDLMLADPIYPGSELVAEVLDLPLVYTLRFSIAHTWERLCGQLPAPPSYVPGAMSKLTDKMDFMDRLWNFLFYGALTPTSACELMGKAEIWLIRTYWDFDFPRPFLPNFKFVGGIHCKPAKPLPEFVQSSGDAGIVVFTLGTMVTNMTAERRDMIASALAQIPQKVLWRYSGEKPKTLGANTKLYDWIPQNDLLGHPKTRAFITHGGTNGIYEAIYHGVPMVGIPMFADQPDNMVHMKAKGAALIMEFNFMETEDLVKALKAVINEPSYKENAMRLSRIHHDRPIKPLDEAVFWVEFTMRNKGAKHLRVQTHELTWYQYHSLDVFAFLLAVTLFITRCYKDYFAHHLKKTC
uniref:UDP-glucuronosyltransferase n=1 Tax=Myripristis murdjan TaxID=586833 RepID=A0A667Y7C4_9TELE